MSVSQVVESAKFCVDYTVILVPFTITAGILLIYCHVD